VLVRPLVIIALALTFGLPFATPAPASAQSYPFTCSIGGVGAAAAVNGAANVGAVQFARSRGAVAAGLQPGQCAFSDRAVRDSEPTQLCFAVTPRVIIFVGPVVDKQGTTFTGPGAALMQSALFGPTKLMNFMVHAGSLGGVDLPCFVIDSFGV
jgi:hypothetical protein